MIYLTYLMLWTHWIYSSTLFISQINFHSSSEATKMVEMELPYNLEKEAKGKNISDISVGNEEIESNGNRANIKPIEMVEIMRS